jgi:hypothetical protein
MMVPGIKAILMDAKPSSKLPLLSCIYDCPALLGLFYSVGGGGFLSQALIPKHIL